MSDKVVLIVDDDRVLLRILETRLQAMGVQTRDCVDGLDALMQIVESPPDLLILDVKLASADGISICERLKRDARYSAIPVIVHTGSSEHEVKDACEALGAAYVQKGEDSWETLRPIVKYLLGMESDGPSPAKSSSNTSSVPPDPRPKDRKPRVLLIDDDQALVKVLQVRLQSMGLEASCAYGGMQGIGMALQEQPDLIISDYDMPEGRANYLLMRLREHPVTRFVPVIIISGYKLSGGRNFALSRELTSLGAKAFLTKPIDMDALLLEVQRFLPLPAKRPANVISAPKEVAHVQSSGR